MGSTIKQLVRRAAGFLFVLLSLIAIMFLYPTLYDAVGKIISLLLLVLWIFLCSAVFEYIVSDSERREEL
jgi:hypothetical protein